MGKKIKKSDLLDEIRSKINQSLQFQQVDPDPLAKKRVDNLRKNPCKDSKFYVNVTLKSAEISKTDKLSERMKHIKVKKYLLTNDEFKQIFELGCIIEVTIIDTEESKSHSVNVTTYGDYAALIGALMPKYFDETCMMQPLKPKKPVIGNNYIEDDLKTARDVGKKKIIYAMGRFNLKAVPDLVKEEYDTEKYDVYTFSLNNMSNVPYVDMTRRTSLEQNVNQFFENVGAMNSVTMFGAKSNLPNYELKKIHAVYDMCTYVNSKMNEIKAGDDAQSNRKYIFYSETRDEVFKDKSQARWDLYASLGGGAWSDWNAAQSQFLTFKSVSSYDIDFKKEALDNGTFKSNVLAYEKTVSLYNNSIFAAIDKSWKQETDFFKKQKPSGLQFTGKYSSEAKGSATSFVMANMVDPPSVVVEPYGGSQIKFNDSIYYKFIVPAQLSCDEKTFLSAVTYANDVRYPMLGDPDAVYAKVEGYFKSNNKIKIKRETIKLESLDYKYTGVDIVLDEVNNAPYTDEMTHETDKYTVPAESYYNDVDRTYFDANSLDDRFKQCQLIYEIMPKIVELPYIFIQDSCYETAELAEEREKKVREDWKDKFLRCCVDTINYDPWEVVTKKLKKLYGIWCKLGAENDIYEFPPIELTNMSDVKCQSCDECMDDCKCAEFKLCDKCYPLDFFGMTGSHQLGSPMENIIGDRSIYGMFSAAGYMYDQANHPLTYAEIARAVFQAVYQGPEAAELPVETFSSLNKYSHMVIGTPYANIRNSAAFQMTGTVLSRLWESDWDRFLQEYVAGLKLGKNMGDLKFAKVCRAGVADGYAYIPTGHDVTFEYNMSTYTFNVKGANPAQTALMTSLIGCDDEQYMTMYKVIAAACAPLTEDMKKFIAYPFMPSILSIIEGKIDKIDKPSEYDEDYVYVPDPGDVKNTFFGALTTGVVQIRFSIYIKRPVLCSFPMKKDASCRTKDNDGFCGLREMFEKPLILCPYNFDLNKEVLKRVARRKRIKMKELAKNLKENTQFIKDAACNADKNLTKIDDIKNMALSEVVDFAELHKDLLALVGKDQTDSSNQESILCESINIESLRSIMLDYDQVFTETAKSIEVEGDDNFDQSKEAITKMIEDFTTLNSSIKKSLIEIALAFPIFNLCQQKYRDYLTEQNLVKPLSLDLKEKTKEDFAKDFMFYIKQRLCFTDIKDKVKKLDLTPSKREAVVEALKKTNFEDAKSLIEEKPEVFDPLIESTAPVDKVLDVIKNLSKLNERQEALLACLRKAVTDNLAPQDSVTSIVDKFTDPPTLLGGMQLATGIVQCAAKLATGISDGIATAINNTVDDAVNPIVDNTSGSEGAKASAKSLASSKLKSTIMTAAEPYITDKLIARSGLGGVAGGFEKGGSINNNVIAGVNTVATGAITLLIEKGGLKDALLAVMEQVLPEMNNILTELTKGEDEELSTKSVGDIRHALGDGIKAEIANKICDDLLGNTGKEIGANVDGALKSGIEEQIESLKKTAEQTPAYNKVVDSIMLRENGEMSDAIMAVVNGTCGLNQSEQNDESVKDSINNNNVTEDSLTQIYKFIKDSCRKYQQLTGDFIDFDSK